jgi:regulator of replication initiation timing
MFPISLIVQSLKDYNHRLQLENATLREAIYDLEKAVFKQKYQVLDIFLSAIDLETQFSIIYSTII